MKILYDHTAFAMEPYGGVSRYFTEIIPRIAASPNASVSVFMGLHINRYGLDAHRGQFHRFFGVRRPIEIRAFRAFESANRRIFARFAPGIRPDVYHQTYYTGMRLPFPGARVVTVHDMTHERFPDLAPCSPAAAHAKRCSIRSASGLICVSKATQRDLIEMLGVSEHKTRVIYHANPLTVPPSATRPLGRPYLLFVGSRRAYKNFPMVLRAYATSRQLRGQLSLVCFGARSFTADERVLIELLGIGEHVRWAAGGDTELATLYSHAEALVYPSLHEGFGIPLLEAMFYGCPVISSATAALSEVAGSAALYVDPTSVEDVRAKLETIASDGALRRKLVAAGRERERQFTWERAASETLDFYRRVSGT